MLLSTLRSSAPARALRHRNFRLYISGNLVNQLGTRVHEIAAGWLVWTLTESATWLGMLALSEMTTRMLTWPFAGVLADRMDRRKVAFIFQAIAALAAGLLAVINILGLMQVWMIILVHGILGLCLGFWLPARIALLSQIVPRDDLPPAVALTSVVSNSSRIVGPAIAGVIIVYSGPTTAFVFNAVTYMLIIVALHLMTLAPREGARSARQSVLKETMEGVRYVVRHPGLRPLALIVLAFSVTVRPVIELFPAFADAIFDKGPGGLSALNSMLGVGACTGALWVSLRSGMRGLTTLFAVACGLGGLAIFLFALTENFSFALACVIFAGWGIVVQGVVSQTLVHAAVDDAVRGRVFSLYSVIHGAAPGLGTFVMGWAADRIGLHAPVAIGGIVGVLLFVFIFYQRQHLVTHLEWVERTPPPPAPIGPG